MAGAEGEFTVPEMLLHIWDGHMGVWEVLNVPEENHSSREFTLEEAHVCDSPR